MQLRGVVSHKGDTLVVFYSLNTSEIWLYKRTTVTVLEHRNSNLFTIMERPPVPLKSLHFVPYRSCLSAVEVHLYTGIIIVLNNGLFFFKSYFHCCVNYSSCLDNQVNTNTP